MKFTGTRGGEKVTGSAACVRGFAANGGLFVPEKFPQVSDKELESLQEMSYPERSAYIAGKFFDEFDIKELTKVSEEAFARFSGGDPVPLVKIDDGVYMLELFHGPTCSFKDISLSLLPYIVEKDMANSKALIVTASSADTGKAVLEGFKDKKNTLVAAYYPVEGVSKLQRIHMTVRDGKNARVAGIKGNADDCIKAVRALFENPSEVEKNGYTLVSADAFNIGTLIPEIAYYFSAYADLLSSNQIEKGEVIDFTVPTGSFGGAMAAYYAKKMGLPIRRIHCANNLNFAVSDFLKTGVYDINRETVRTTSPSMDVNTAVNIERLIFEVSGRNSKLTAKRMEELKESGKFSVSEEEKRLISEVFDGGYAGEEDSVEAMYDVFVDTGYTMDTHTGCAMKVAVDWFEHNKKDETKMVIVSTADPYKCPQDVLYAVTGNDVKDSFKGIKRLYAATAMTPPPQLKSLRDKIPDFTEVIDKKKFLSHVVGISED